MTLLCHKHANKRRELDDVYLAFLVVALPGLEPGNAAPKTVVLPLHYKAIPMSIWRRAAKIAVQNYCFFLNYNLFCRIFLKYGILEPCLLLDDEQVVVLLTLLC